MVQLVYISLKKSELSLFESPALCGHMNVHPLLNMYTVYSATSPSLSPEGSSPSLL